MDFRSEMRPPAKIRCEVELLRKENKEYRQMIRAIQNEVYGARLAAKYLDKELAGRYILLSKSFLAKEVWNKKLLICRFSCDFHQYI